jgi:hypothetical protein
LKPNLSSEREESSKGKYLSKAMGIKEKKVGKNQRLKKSNREERRVR